MTPDIHLNPNKNNSTGKKTVLIIDDHKLLRESLSQILNNQSLFNIVAACGGAEEGIHAALTYQPDFLIMDINMPGMNGIDAIPLVKKASPKTKIIGMSMHALPNYARKMIKSGASAYVTKNSPIDELLKAIDEAGKGKKYICTQIKDLISEQYASENKEDANVESLSEREIEIINLIRKGCSSKEIAVELHIAIKTVEVHRYNILKKLHLNNAAALVNYINANYIEP